MFSLPRRLTPICSVDLSETIDDFKVVDLRPIQIAKLKKKSMHSKTLHNFFYLLILLSLQSMNRIKHKIKRNCTMTSWSPLNIMINLPKLTLEIASCGQVMMDLNLELSDGLAKSEMKTMMLY